MKTTKSVYVKAIHDDSGADCLTECVKETNYTEDGKTVLSEVFHLSKGWTVVEQIASEDFDATGEKRIQNGLAVGVTEVTKKALGITS